MRRALERIHLTGPAGRLEGLLHRPAGAGPRFGAVVAHPHPLHGGSMDNKVTYRIARALEEAGGLILRFNFRGAGCSEGLHDEGRGERDDLRAALRELRERGGADRPTLLAGFSFGAVMSAAVALADPDVEALLLVGAPVRLHDLAVLRDFGRPIALVVGDRDEHAPLDRVESLVRGLPEPRALRVIRGAGHFFDGHQGELAEAVRGLVTDGILAPVLAPVLEPGVSRRRATDEPGGGIPRRRPRC